jgi:acetyl esterase/lipase
LAGHVLRPPFDPELEKALAPTTEQAAASITLEMIPALRSVDREAVVDDGMLAEAGVERVDHTIAGYEGADIEVSVLRRTDHEGAGPGICYLHAGGMVLGDRFLGLTQILPWVVRHDAVAVTVEYRLAPEFPDPYPVEDSYAGLTWAAGHAGELGIDPARLIVAGASAGGGLAAGTALLARDRHGPPLLGQVLIYPMLDDRDQTGSAAQFDGVGVWDRASNVTGWSALLGERRAGDDVSIYAAPARATDLSGLPPAFIDCGSAEVFRDEDVAYATSLWRCGIQAELHVWPGGFHAFDLTAPDTALAQAMTGARDAWVNRLFTT